MVRDAVGQKGNLAVSVVWCNVIGQGVVVNDSTLERGNVNTRQELAMSGFTCRQLADPMIKLFWRRSALW